MQINVSIMLDKAKALEAAFEAVGADEFAFLCDMLPAVDNQCTNNVEADDILEDLRAAYEGRIVYGFDTVKEHVSAIRKLYKCEAACQYATLMTFGHNLKPRDVEQIMCGEFVNLRDCEDGGIELEDYSREDDTWRIFNFMKFGVSEIVREVLCRYVVELQKQSGKR